MSTSTSTDVYTNAQVKADPSLATKPTVQPASGKLVSASDLRQAAGGPSGKTIVQASLTINDNGEYVVTFPSSIPLSAVTRSSTGKSFIATIRVEMGRSKEPLLVMVDGDEEPIALGFGSFNINLTLTPKG